MENFLSKYIHRLIGSRTHLTQQHRRFLLTNSWSGAKKIKLDLQDDDEQTTICKITSEMQDATRNAL